MEGQPESALLVFTRHLNHFRPCSVDPSGVTPSFCSQSFSCKVLHGHPASHFSYFRASSVPKSALWGCMWDTGLLPLARASSADTRVQPPGLWLRWFGAGPRHMGFEFPRWLSDVAKRLGLWFLLPGLLLHFVFFLLIIIKRAEARAIA